MWGDTLERNKQHAHNYKHIRNIQIHKNKRTQTDTKCTSHITYAHMRYEGMYVFVEFLYLCTCGVVIEEKEGVKNKESSK